MRIAFALLLLAFVGTRAHANQILDLANRADVIVLGAAISVSEVGPYTVAYKVRADFVLKGYEPVGSIISTTLSDIGKGIGKAIFSDDLVYIPSSLEEMHGLWFLKQESDGYASVPREGRVFGIEWAFVRLPKFWTPEAGIALERQLFSAALECRRHSLSSAELIRRGEDRFGERLATNSLLYADRFGFRNLALEFVNELLASPSNEERNFGTLLGVGMTHGPALARLETDLASVRLNPRTMQPIIGMLETNYAPRDALDLARLDRLVRMAQRERIPGFELALARAVRKIKSREMLPLARKLLDSQDPEAVRVASNSFYVYSVLAGTDGRIPRGGKGRGKHPFASEQTKLYNGTKTSISAAEHAEFWREWWDEKQADIAARVAEK